jgi:hypothetical protein
VVQVTGDPEAVKGGKGGVYAKNSCMIQMLYHPKRFKYPMKRNNPKEVVQKSLDNMQWLLDMGARCMEEGKPEEIVSRYVDRWMPEVEKIRAARGEEIYKYLTEELVFSMSNDFANYYTDLHQRQ